ncbi:MAG: glycosyltransferase family 1 protein [Candidatus Zixiibacteriota bacterium]|nr:MAG: glycosyltransferase family 1 protein [candidate division Zixibacteria bacterium]
MLVNESLQDLTITLCYRPIQATRDKQHLVTSLLSEAGYRVAQASNQRLHLTKTDILWILENANWFPIVCRQLQTMPRSERPTVVIWHSEPLPPPKSAGLSHPCLHLRDIAKILLSDRLANDAYTNYFRLRALMDEGIPDLLLVSTPGRQQFLAEHGFSSKFVPLGYHRAEYGYDMGLQRDIEVLFLGALKIPHRKRLLKRLRGRGTNLVAKGSWSDADHWGENRTELLNRTKVFLNLQRYPGELSGARLILGMANRALVISEPIYKPGDFIPGKHFVSATSDEMPEVIEYYLNHDAERECIAAEGHRLVTQELTMERSISEILELISNHVNQ